MKKIKSYCIKCRKEMTYWEPAWAFICDNKACEFRGIHQQGIDEKELVEEIESSIVCDQCGHNVSIHSDRNGCVAVEDCPCGKE